MSQPKFYRFYNVILISVAACLALNLGLTIYLFRRETHRVGYASEDIKQLLIDKRAAEMEKRLYAKNEDLLAQLLKAMQEYKATLQKHQQQMQKKGKTTLSKAAKKELSLLKEAAEDIQKQLTYAFQKQEAEELKQIDRALEEAVREVCKETRRDFVLFVPVIEAAPGHLNVTKRLMDLLGLAGTETEGKNGGIAPPSTE